MHPAYRAALTNSCKSPVRHGHADPPYPGLCSEGRSDGTGRGRPVSSSAT